MSRFARFSWGVLVYNVLVILWGAYVRASGSGAGCGKHWPMCNGEVIPRAPHIETLVELFHRLTSGVSLALCAILAVASFFQLEKGHPARKTACWSFAFVMGEALIGAGLVLFELVAHDASTKRALSMMLHLCNTFLLLGALTLTAHYASGGAKIRVRGQGAVVLPLALAFAGMFVLGASGAIAALGDTLFPARSLSEGMSADLSPSAHAFVRLRVLHPFLALAVGLVVTVASTFARVARPNAPRVRTLSRALTMMFIVQICIGLLNLRMLVPIWTQLLHLCSADIVWVLLVLTTAETLRADHAQPLLAGDPAPAPGAASEQG
jgi:heme A synthase